MRNQLASVIHDEGGSSRTEIDAAPHARLVVLAILFALPLVVIGTRLVYVQSALADRYIAAWETTSESTERIPARDGRIVSRDGVVLAYDRPQYDLAVHYRWIESPPNPEWVRQQALARLSRAERRDSELVERAQEQVRREHTELWQRLVELSGESPESIEAVRHGIQQRIERMAESVRKRAAERAAGRAQPAASTTSGWWGVLEQAYRELTTPPRRADPRHLVIKEEVSDHVVLEDVSLDTIGAIQVHPSRFPGVRIVATTHRVYPEHDLAAHVVGLRRESTGENAETTGRRGQFGIERTYDRYLRGRAGENRLVRSRRGELLAEDVLVAPQDGADVVLTLDARLQRRVEQIFDEALADQTSLGENPNAPEESRAPPRGAALIAFDIWTGDILVAASAPRVDLNVLLHPTHDEWQALINDSRGPLFPRASQMAIPPGSVFKVLTAIAALESGAVDPNEPHFCRGFLDNPDSHRCAIYRHYGYGHGEVTLSDALCQSCNVYFFQLAREMGPEVMTQWATRVGFGRQTGVDLPGEATGHVPDRDNRAGGSPWYPGTTLQFSIGQATLTVTPLQVARMMAVIANGGHLVTPRIALPPGRNAMQATDGGGQFMPRPASVERIAELSEETIRTIRHGLEQVVAHPRGTGKAARVPGISVAGKTGTAEAGGGRTDHAWFAGYLPAERPRFAFVVVLEQGGGGGAAAAPLASRLGRLLQEQGYLTSDAPAGSSPQPTD